jgi:hypothetical protein
MKFLTISTLLLLSNVSVFAGEAEPSIYEVFIQKNTERSNEELSGEKVIFSSPEEIQREQITSRVNLLRHSLRDFVTESESDSPSEDILFILEQAKGAALIRHVLANEGEVTKESFLITQINLELIANYREEETPAQEAIMRINGLEEEEVVKSSDLGTLFVEQGEGGWNFEDPIMALTPMFRDLELIIDTIMESKLEDVSNEEALKEIFELLKNIIESELKEK